MEHQQRYSSNGHKPSLQRNPWSFQLSHKARLCLCIEIPFANSSSSLTKCNSVTVTLLSVRTETHKTQFPVICQCKQAEEFFLEFSLLTCNTKILGWVILDHSRIRWPSKGKNKQSLDLTTGTENTISQSFNHSEIITHFLPKFTCRIGNSVDKPKANK